MGCCGSREFELAEKTAARWVLEAEWKNLGDGGGSARKFVLLNVISQVTLLFSSFNDSKHYEQRMSGNEQVAYDEKRNI